MSYKKSWILINDIFEEITEENRRLLNELLFADKCLKTLTEVKTFIDTISNKLKSTLNSVELQNFEELYPKLEQIIDRKEGIKVDYNANNCSVDCKPEVNQTKKSVKRLKTRWTPKKKRITKTLIKSEENVNSIANNVREVKRRGRPKQKRKQPIVKPKQKPISKSLLPKNRVCDYPECEYRCHFQSRMNEHIRLKHDINRPHDCPHCGQTLSSKSSLKYHLQSTHKDIYKKFVCGIDNCTKQLKNENTLKIHQNHYHLMPKKFVCRVKGCDFKSATKEKLTAHTTVHSTDRFFKCHFHGCDRIFKHQGSLQAHVKCHSTDNIFQCPYEGCGKAFNTSTRMGIHIRGSHREQIYRCDWPGCDYTTHRKDGVKTHSAVHSSEFTVACIWPQCDKMFKTKATMRQHLKIHSGEKPNVCHWPGCQYRCVTPGNLRLHMKVHQKS